MLLTCLPCTPILLAAAMLPGIAFAAPADDREMLEGMRACATIADQARRTSCYDGHLRPQGVVPPAAGPAAAASAPVDNWAPAPKPAKPVAVARAPERESRLYNDAVASAVEREPGIYLLTMRDGRQWRFASTVRASYDPPRAGATVAIQPGALGSFLLSYNDQSAIRVIRVR